MILWSPDATLKQQAELTKFQKFVQEKTGFVASCYQQFYDWSVQEAEQFWSLFWDFSMLTGASKGARIFRQDPVFEKSRYFPEATLNYAENLLQGPDQQEALIFRAEGLNEKRLTYGDLRRQVHHLQSFLKEKGVGAGDRVAGYLPNIPEAVVAMLAATSLGAIWSSCSTDFGSEGLLDRFGQIQPKIVLTSNGSLYKGTKRDCLDKIGTVLAEIPCVEQVIVIDYVTSQSNLSALPQAVWYHDLMDQPVLHPMTFLSVPFDHPLFILFSSGTTGKPKCLIHGHGGTLLQHLKEHRLHCDLKPGDRLFFYTTTGWMMWNWLMTGLASQATLLLYDGSPFYPGPEVLWDYVSQEKATHFGTSAKYIDALQKEGFALSESYDVASLKMILSTGSPLIPKSFDYVYEKLSPHSCLASISGGTDILSCFALGNMTEPVYRGELQTLGLGMAVDVFDESGNSVRGEKGELVCTKPFPSMPVGFWNDPKGEKFHQAYFTQFPGVWHHGDFVELTDNGGMIIYGRSDAVLNPGGVRIGTAEIYRQVDPLNEIQGSLVMGQRWQDDVRVILFVQLAPGHSLDEDLILKIKRAIREKTTPRHVPSKIIPVADIPRTLSGKIVEMAVSQVVHGQVVKNTDALANPEALELFKDLPALQE